MREQDEALADTMSRIRVKKGEDEGDDESPDDDDDTIIDKITVVGPEVRVRDLRRVITTICVDRLTPNWDEMYGRLRTFRKKNGQCRVPTTSPKTNLGSWVSSQRSLYKAGKLSVARIALLEKVGFEWNIMPPKETYATWEEAGEAARKLGIKSSQEYVSKQHYKKDPKLPSSPSGIYPGFPGWRMFLRGERKKGWYPTWQEAGKAARVLGIGKQVEYKSRYMQDPRLPSNPNATYSNFPGFPEFLRGQKKVPFRSTWEEAAEAARALGIGSHKEYKERYKEDSRLPACPHRTYPDFPGWVKFLSGKEKIKPYSTWEEAAEAARVLQSRSYGEYSKRYKQDPRLPSAPNQIYPDFPGWTKFLGKERVLYSTWQEAGEAARALGISKQKEYKSRYKEDPRLPSNPDTFYNNFPGWPTFLGN
jgi:hypothetical protein